MRLFIALDIPQKQKDLLEKSVQQLKPFAVKGTYVPKENYHITLQFLGEVEFSRVLYLQNLLDELKSFRVIDTANDQIAHWRAADLVCAKYTCGKALKEVFAFLGENLKQNGYFCEERKFVPHITLMRRPIFTMPFTEIKKSVDVFNKPFVASEVKLYSSELKSGGAEYTELYGVTLAKPTA